MLTNIGPSAFGLHPVHLHGHSFQVLYQGFPPVYPDTHAVCKWPAGDAHPTCLSTADVTCALGTGCAEAKWTNGQVPPLNLVQPPRKDTVVVPPGGYVVVRVVLDNPGWWHLHCHMAHHMESGMSMFVNAAPELQPKFPPPPGFPTCGSLPESVELDSFTTHSRAKWEALMT